MFWLLIMRHFKEEGSEEGGGMFPLGLIWLVKLPLILYREVPSVSVKSLGAFVI